MTVLFSTAKAIYEGNGLTTHWEIPFPFMDKADLQIYVIDASGQEVLQTDNYAVDTQLHEVIYPLENNAVSVLPEGKKLMILRRTPLVQDTYFENKTNVRSDVLEEKYDRGMMIAQELAEQLDRAVKFPASSSGKNTDAASYLAQLEHIQTVTADTAALLEQSVQEASQTSHTAAQASAQAMEAASRLQNSIKDISDAKEAALEAKTAAESAVTSAQAQADLARWWAVKTDGPVEQEEYSAKYHAQQTAVWAAAASSSVSESANQAASSAQSAATAEEAASSATASALAAAEQAQNAADSAVSAAQSAAQLSQVQNALSGKADTDLSNLSATGKSVASGLGMPSNRYTELELGATEATYTMPFNGYVALIFNTTSNFSYCHLYNSTTLSGVTSVYGQSGLNSVRMMLPVKKDETFVISYGGLTFTTSRLLKAEGEE